MSEYGGTSRPALKILFNWCLSLQRLTSSSSQVIRRVLCQRFDAGVDKAHNSNSTHIIHVLKPQSITINSHPVMKGNMKPHCMFS